MQGPGPALTQALRGRSVGPQLAAAEAARSVRGILEAVGPRVPQEAAAPRQWGVQCPKPRWETCLQSGAGVRAAKYWNEAAPPATHPPGAWAGPGSRGELCAGATAFGAKLPEPPALTRTPDRTQQPTARAQATPLFANRCARGVRRETYMCSRQVHSFHFIFIFLQKALLEHET